MQEDLTVFVRKVKTVLEFYEALYNNLRVWMLFAKQYLVGNAAAA